MCEWRLASDPRARFVTGLNKINVVGRTQFTPEGELKKENVMKNVCEVEVKVDLKGAPQDEGVRFDRTRQNHDRGLMEEQIRHLSTFR